MVRSPEFPGLGRSGRRFSVSIQFPGYTIEQHEERLKKRESELRAEFQAAQGQSEERRKTIERELQGVTSQLRDSQRSYGEKLSELKYLAGELDALRGRVPDAKLDVAAEALQKGETTGANELVTGAKDGAPQTSFVRKTLDLRFPTPDLQFERKDLQFQRKDLQFQRQDMQFFIEATDK